MTIDRRQMLLAGAGGLLASSFAATGLAQDNAADARFADLYSKAKAEGQVTWYVAQIDAESAERVGRLFESAYPGVKANVVRATGQVIYQRLRQDIKAGVANCDVFGTTDLGHCVALRRDNRLAGYHATNLSASVPLFRDYDPDRYVSITGANCTSLVFNSQTVAAIDAPKTWQDLLDPKWAGQIAVGHPGYSGAMGAWVVEMKKRFGWRYFEKLAANRPHVGRSLVEPPTIIASGERKVGLGPSNLIINLKSEGRPVDVAYPPEGVILQIAPTSILTDAPHPNAARLLLEFLLSKTVGDELASGHGIPFREDVRAQGGVVPIASLSVIRPDPEELEKDVPEAIEKWRDIFGV